MSPFHVRNPVPLEKDRVFQQSEAFEYKVRFPFHRATSHEHRDAISTR